MALPSLRPGSISPGLLDAAKMVRKSGLTIAPEAGTERLRLFIRKDFPDAAIYDTVRMAFEKGWKGIKLYFMVGLPTETDEDLHGIVNVIHKCYDIGREYPRHKGINVTLSPFVPKPHTPFQWDAVVAPEEVERRILLIKRSCRARGVNFKYHSTETAMLAGLLGRGGREMSKVIEQVYNEGCRFDGWSETFQPDKWFSACRDNGIDIEAQLRPIPFDQPLPWDHIRKGVTFEHLKKERHRTSAQLTDYKLQFQGDSSETPNNGPQMTFGRSNKRVASRQTTSAPTKNRARIKWSKGPRYRYMSHLENMAMIERALRRARLPVAYSQGFNPSMKLSFGPPLPLGFTSEAEFVDVTLESNLMPYMIEGFREALPDGIKIISAAVVFGKTRSLSASLNRVVYTVPLAGLDHSTLDDGIGHLMECNSIPVERKNKDKTKIVDVRPGIYDLKVEDDQLVMVLGLGEGRYVRATEVMSLLLDGDAKRVAGLPIHRRDMYRQEADSVIGALDL
jgi:radical SAM-linked protein